MAELKRDLRLLNEMDIDSRRPLSLIARSAGMSQQLASYKLKTFQERGLLTGFYAAVDYSRFGYICFKTYFSVNYTSSEQFSSLVRSIASNPFIIEVNECGGRWDLEVSFIARNASRFNKNLRQLISENPSLKNYDVVTNVVTHYFGRRFLQPSAARKDIILGGDRDPVPVSQRDAAVLSAVLSDPRATSVNIASGTGLNPKTVHASIIRLRELGIIKGFKPLVDVDKMGFIRNRMMIKYHNITPAREKEIVTYCGSNINVTEVHKVLGSWDLEIDLETRPGPEFRSVCMAIREGFQDIIKENEVIELFSQHKKSLLTPEALAESLQKSAQMAQLPSA